jgi:hypothetical protein
LQLVKLTISSGIYVTWLIDGMALGDDTETYAEYCSLCVCKDGIDIDEQEILLNSASWDEAL